MDGQLAKAVPTMAITHATIVDASPSTIVGHAMDEGAVPFGLDRPLALRGGGDRLRPTGMPIAPGIDHVPGLRNLVAEACRRSWLKGGTAYRQTPLALLGPVGAGKGYVAAWIALNAALPLFRTSIGSVGALRPALSGSTVQRMPPFPIVAMATCGCANPIIVVEMDADGPLHDEETRDLAIMMDPRRNARVVVQEPGIIVDLSHVSWIVEVRSSWIDRSVASSSLAAAVRPAVLPERLATLFDEVGGSQIALELSRETEALRRIDVVASTCALRGVADARISREVHSSLERLASSQGTPLPTDRLVRHAEESLAEAIVGSPG